MNISQLSEQLKDVPQGTLVGYAKNPNSVVPQFLALAEIQRRQHLQAQAPAPTGTVADDVLAQANPVPQQMMPQQMAPQQVDPRILQAQAMQQQAQQLPENQPGVAQLPTGMPQGMASGGIVAFASGDLVDDEEDDREMAQLFPQQSSSSFDQLLAALPSSVAGGIRGLADKGSQAYQNVRAAIPQSYEQARASASGPEIQEADAKGFLAKLQHLESRGKHFDSSGNILTSPKGAEGIMQVMRHTQKDPGYGVSPARDKSPEELERVGKEYGLAMLREFKDPQIAAMAYNWGPGNVKKWLASDKTLPVPKETLQYRSHFVDGGRVKSYAGNGPDESQVEDDSLKDNEYLQRSRGVVDLVNNAGNALTNPKNYDLYKMYKENIGDPFAAGVKRFVDEPVESQAQRFRAASMNPNKEPELGYRIPAGSKTPVPYGKAPSMTLDEANRLANIAAANHAQKKEGLDYKKANIPNSGPTNQDWKDFDQASALFEAENKIKDLQAPTIPAAPSKADRYADALEKSLEKQMIEAEQNKKLQLGLSLLGAGAAGLQSGSRYLGQNLGASLAGGVSTYGALKKQEQDQAKDIMAGQLGLYKYGASAEASAANRASEEKYKDLVLAQKGQISQAELAERMRAHDLTATQYANQNLINIGKMLAAKYAKNYNLTPEQQEAAVYSDPLYINAAKKVPGMEDISASMGPVQIKDKADYDKLQPGQQYRDPQGQLRTKG
jgi:hypothetical protein